MIREAIGCLEIHHAFKSGADTTVAVILCQLLQSHREIFGRSYPIHFIDITEKSDEDNVELMKECMNGNHWEKSAGVKVVVVTLQ